MRKGFAYYLPEGVEGKKFGLCAKRTLSWGDTKGPLRAVTGICDGITEKRICLSIDFPAKDERVIRYLKGETVDVSDLECGKEKGWQLVCVDGYPLGWGKLVNGTLKNKYLSGWRMKVNG